MLNNSEKSYIVCFYFLFCTDLPYRSRQTLIIHVSFVGCPRLSTAMSSVDTFTCIAVPADYVISLLPDRDGAVDTFAR